MIEIVLIQCLLKDIDHCRTMTFPMLEATTTTRCMDLIEERVNLIGKQYPLWFNRMWYCQDSAIRNRIRENL